MYGGTDPGEKDRILALFQAQMRAREAGAEPAPPDEAGERAERANQWALAAAGGIAAIAITWFVAGVQWAIAAAAIVAVVGAAVVLLARRRRASEDDPDGGDRG